jgi:hypothetical protein
MILSRPHTGTVTKSGSKIFNMDPDPVSSLLRTITREICHPLPASAFVFFSSPSRPTSHPGSVYNTDPDPIHILKNHPALCQFRLSIHNLFSLLRVRIQRSIELSALSLPAASAFLLYSTRSNLEPNHFHIRSSYELDSQKISFCLPPKYLRIRKVRPQGSARRKMSKIRFFHLVFFLVSLFFL